MNKNIQRNPQLVTEDAYLERAILPNYTTDHGLTLQSNSQTKNVLLKPPVKI